MKDAGGHGSNGRGGGDAAAHQAGVNQAGRQPLQYTPGQGYPAGGRQGYNPQAVQQAINSSNRFGPRIGGSEAKMIHALLRGRG